MQVECERAQLAVAAADAGVAVAVVLREEQLEDGAAPVAGAGGVGLDHHAVGGRLGARGDQRLGPLDLHQAEAAGADGLDALQIAEGGDLGAGLPAGVQDGGALGHLDLDVVYSQDWHYFTSPCASAAVAPGAGRRGSHRDLAVVAAQAALGFGAGGLEVPGQLHLVEGAGPGLRVEAHDGRPRCGHRVGVGVEEHVHGDVAAPEGVVGAGEVLVDGHGGPLAGAYRLDHRGRAGDRVAAGEDPLDAGGAGRGGRP